MSVTRNYEQQPRREQEQQSYNLASRFLSKQAAEHPYVSVQETIMSDGV
jgi:hypothetical protein